MKKRAYTILVVGNGAMILRRFRVTHRALVGAIAGTVSLGTVGVVCGLVLPPLAITWLSLQRKVESLEVQNRLLQDEQDRVKGWVTEVGDRLERFEADALRLSALAEIAGGRPGRGSGGPLLPAGPVGLPEENQEENQIDALAGLRGRSEVLERKMNDLEASLMRRADRLSSLPLVFPAEGPLGDGFGWRTDPFTGETEFHQGLDILAPFGAPVRAPGSGTVSQCGYETGYGLSVFLLHPGGIETRFGHLCRTIVHPGDPVAPGQVIGYVGNTGRSAGPHLHYEVLFQDRHIDPSRFLRSLGIPLSRPPTS